MVEQRPEKIMPGGRVFLALTSGSAKSGLRLYSLPVPETGLAMCKAALAKKEMGKGKQVIAEVFRIHSYVYYIWL